VFHFVPNQPWRGQKRGWASHSSHAAVPRGRTRQRCCDWTSSLKNSLPCAGLLHKITAPVKRPRGGIGRRDGFKIHYPKGVRVRVPPRPSLLLLMRSRSLRIIVLIFQTLWLGVLVPGHRRGVIALPGEASVTALSQERSCCPVDESKGKHAPQTPCSRDPAEHCAICHMALRLSVPPTIDIVLPPCGLAETLVLARCDAPISISTVPTYDGRAPPAALLPSA
jgi:hypothetical protein